MRSDADRLQELALLVKMGCATLEIRNEFPEPRFKHNGSKFECEHFVHITVKIKERP